MGLNHSPKIVTNGLVFAYDMSNTSKSWKGKPTTNEAKNASNQVDWVIGNLNQAVSRTTVIPEEMYFISSSSLTGTSFRIYFTNAVLTNGATYTVSYKYKFISGGNLFRANDWCDTTITRVTTDLGNGVFYETATGTRATYDVTYRFLDLEISNNTVVQIWDLQLELGSFATPYSSTRIRSNTQSILDLTGLNTITATSLTYNSNNTFRFAGSDSIATTYVPINTAGSISVWFKINAHKDYNTIFDNALGANDWEFWVYSTGVARFRSTADNGDYILDSDVLLTGIYYNFVITWSNTTATLYKNGVFMSQDTTAGTKVTPGVMYFGGGNAGNTKLDGELPCAFAYNRALSASEVNQNFNALRGRYGL